MDCLLAYGGTLSRGSAPCHKSCGDHSSIGSYHCRLHIIADFNARVRACRMEDSHEHLLVMCSPGSLHVPSGTVLALKEDTIVPRILSSTRYFQCLRATSTTRKGGLPVEYGDVQTVVLNIQLSAKSLCNLSESRNEATKRLTLILQ